jgi:hypothetical protein
VTAAFPDLPPVLPIVDEGQRYLELPDREQGQGEALRALVAELVQGRPPGVP